MSVPQMVRDSLRGQINDRLRRRGIDPSVVEINRLPSGYLSANSSRSDRYEIIGSGDVIDFVEDVADDQRSGEAASADGERSTIEESAVERFREDLADINVETQGGASSLSLSTVRQRFDAATEIGTGSRVTLNLPDGLGALVFPSGEELSAFERLVSSAPDASINGVRISDLGDAPELADRMAERRERRQNREAARDAAEAAGVDTDEFGIDARADGTVVLQDRDTDQTRTIDPDEDLGDAIDQQTDGDSFEPTSLSSNDATSSGPSVDDLGGGRLAAAVAIGAAILYGLLQS